MPSRGLVAIGCIGSTSSGREGEAPLLQGRQWQGRQLLLPPQVEGSPAALWEEAEAGAGEGAAALSEAGESCTALGEEVEVGRGEGITALEAGRGYSSSGTVYI